MSIDDWKIINLLNCLKVIEDDLDIVYQAGGRYIELNEPNLCQNLQTLKNAISSLDYLLPVYRKYERYNYLGNSEYTVTFDTYYNRYRIHTDKGLVALPRGIELDIYRELKSS